MASRDGVVVRVDVPCDGGVSPNRKIPLVTVEIRAHWPDPATDEQIDQALIQALGKTTLEIQMKRTRQAMSNVRRRDGGRDDT